MDKVPKILELRIALGENALPILRKAKAIFDDDSEKPYTLTTVETILLLARPEKVRFEDTNPNAPMYEKIEEYAEPRHRLAEDGLLFVKYKRIGE